MSDRVATIQRSTRETRVELTLNLDGAGGCLCLYGAWVFRPHA